MSRSSDYESVLMSMNINMKKMIKSLVLLITAATLEAWAATPDQPVSTNAPSAKPALKAPDLFVDNVVAKGKGVEVKRGQLDDEVMRLRSQAASGGQAIPAEQLQMVEQKVLDQLIGIQLLLAKATDSDKTAGKGVAEKRFEDIKTRLGSDETLNRRLKAEGITRDELLSKWSDAATAEAVVKRELQVSVSPEEAKKYYDDNPARFEQPEMVRASHILLSTRDANTNAELPEDKKVAKRKQMEELLKRARAGEDFAKLAKEYSEDPASKDKGGEYKFPRGQMAAEFEAAAFSLNTNQISDIVTTMFGYHIIKQSEKIPSRKEAFAGPETKSILLKPDGSNATIREILSDLAMQKQIPTFFAKLKKDAGVEILDEKLKPKEDAEPLGLPAAQPPVKKDGK